MSYRSGGSRSGSGGRRSTSGGGSSGRGGWQGAGWDDDRDDAGGYGRGYEGSRRSSSSSSRSRDEYGARRSSRGGWDDEDDGGWGASRRASGSRDPWNPPGRGEATVGGWDNDDDDDQGWGSARESRGSRSGGRRNSKLLMFGFAALLLVIAAAVVGVLVLPGRGAHPSVSVPDDPFATFTPGATPTVPAHFKAFQSDRAKYSIIYPEAWNVTSKQQTTQGQYDDIDLFALQNAPSQLVVEQAGAASSYTDAQLIQNAVTLAQQNGVTFAKAQTQTPAPKIGGVTWARQDYSVNANGTPVYMAMLACHHSGRGYVIVLVSSASEFGNDDQAVFQPMLGNFVFL